MSTDLTGQREQIVRGAASAEAAFESALQQALAPANRHTFISLQADAGRAAARGVDAQRACVSRP